MNLVVLGAPGAGKGTQGRNLAKHFQIAHVSTGDLLRNEMAQKSQIGLAISEKMDKGILISDDIVTALLLERLKEQDCENGFILDGYPRTLSQAKILDEMLTLDKAIYVVVPDEVIVERMSGRYMCAQCGAVYHLTYHPPKEKNICDLCGGHLIQRDDDKTKTVLNRLEIYHQVTEPIIEYYAQQNLLIQVSGIGEMQEITAEILNALGEGNGWQYS